MSNIFWFYYDAVWLTSMMIIVFFLLRLLLHRQSKVLTNLLWLFLLIRLLCPLTLKSDFGVIPEKVNETFSVNRKEENFVSITESTVNYDVGKAIELLKAGTADDGIKELDITEPEFVGTEVVAPEVENRNGNKTRRLIDVVPDIWLAGIVLFVLIDGIHRLILHRKKRYAVRIPERENVYEWPDVTNACVLGVFRPKIYVPTGLDEAALDNILLHERMHIRRFDHITTTLYQIALWLNWLNPLCWMAYFRYRTDTELACDEQALRHKGVETRRNYASTLLSMGIAKQTKEASALSFNKGDLKKRIIHAGKEYKVRPSMAAVVSLLCLLLLATVVFIKDSGAKFEALKREIAKEQFSAKFPRICYADDETLIFYDYHGIFVYDLEERELCGYASFEENGFKEIGNDGLVRVFASLDGTSVYVFINNRRQFRYDVSEDVFEEGKFELDELCLWSPEVYTGFHKEEPKDCDISQIFVWSEDTYYYLTWDINDQESYSSLCFVVDQNGKKDVYYIFQ